MSQSKAMILAPEGYALTANEKSFFRDERPWGFILFSRNITKEPERLSDFIEELRDVIASPEAPIFVDQEGGRIQRLRPPLAREYPPADRLARIFEDDPDRGERAVWLMSRLHAFDLTRYGFNVDCLPVLDLPSENAHNVIGDRAYGTDPAIVRVLGQAAMDGLMAGGVLPVIKHIPGHGRAQVDSHKALPVVEASFDELAEHDFKPFAALSNAPMAMTAHVVYSAIDPDEPATTSGKLIEEVIRGHMGFDGLLMTDDLEMGALSHPFDVRAKKSFDAGCDMALHCSGDFAEMRSIASETPELSGIRQDRAERAMIGAGRSDGADRDDVEAEFDELLNTLS